MDLPLRIILFTIMCISSSVAPHLATKHKCNVLWNAWSTPFSNGVKDINQHERLIDQVQDRLFETIPLWVHFGILFPSKGISYPSSRDGCG